MPTISFEKFPLDLSLLPILPFWFSDIVFFLPLKFTPRIHSTPFSFLYYPEEGASCKKPRCQPIALFFVTTGSAKYFSLELILLPAAQKINFSLIIILDRLNL